MSPGDLLEPEVFGRRPGYGSTFLNSYPLPCISMRLIKDLIRVNLVKVECFSALKARRRVSISKLFTFEAGARVDTSMMDFPITVNKRFKKIFIRSIYF